MKRILVLLILLASSAAGQVSTPLAIARTSEGGALLGVPRYKGGQQGDTLILMFGSHGSGDDIWAVSPNRGASWTSVSGIAYLNDHSSAWFDHGLHIVYREGTNSDPAVYRHVSAPYTQFSDMGPIRRPTNTNSYYPIVVVDGRGDTWLFDINGGGGFDNLRYWRSSDNFAMPATVGRVCYPRAVEPQNAWRMGAVVGEDGWPVVSIYDGNLGFAILTYNGVDWDSTHATSLASGLGGRFYTQAEMNGRTHLAWGYNGQLLHHVEQADGSFSSGEVIATFSNGRVAPQFCVYGEGASARLYVVYYPASGPVYVKSWTTADGWDATATQVSGPGHNGPDPQTCPTIPSSYNFVPFWYHDQGGSNNIYFVKLDAVGGVIDSIPPSDVEDLSAVPGTVEGSIELSWTAAGDDDFSGTAAGCEIRYSLSSFTSATWSSQILHPSVPSPVPGGQAQTHTVIGLESGELYYLAIKTYDEAGNYSAMSPVVSSPAYDISLDVAEEEGLLPSRAHLAQNYPNPFNPATVIPYSIAQAGHVTLQVFNTLGQQTCTLVDQIQPAGSHQVVWPGLDQEARPVSTGVYFYRLSTSEQIESRKMVLAK